MKTRYLAAVVLLALALHLDWWHWVSGSETGPSNTSQGGVQQNMFLLEQYKHAVAEIQTRLEQESLLFGLKFTLVGAILAVLFKSHLDQKRRPEEAPSLPYSPSAASFFWSAVLAGALVDGRLMFNVAFIETLGTWIRLIVEPQLGAPDIGWEAWLKTSDLMTAWSYPCLRMHASMLTMVLFALSLFLFCRRSEAKCAPAVMRISAVGATAVVAAFCLSALHFHPNSGGWACAVASTGLCAAAILMKQLWRRA